MNPSTSDTQITRAEINKANAQHSTGPKTSAGKQRSSLNALRHGLTGQLIVLPSDDLEAYQNHVQSFVEEYHPKGATEAQLVQSLADTAWRQNRVAALETNLLTLGAVREFVPLSGVSEPTYEALAIAASLDSQTRALANLSLHGQRLARQFEKTLALLRDLQTTRQTRETEELGQALDLIQMHELEGEPYDPADDGFVFSPDEIDTALRLRDRDHRATQAFSCLA
jgi:hypothetical protein